MMTPERSKKWFEQCPKVVVEIIVEETDGDRRLQWNVADTNTMYQAFAARIFQDFKRESVCNCLINVPSDTTPPRKDEK